MQPVGEFETFAGEVNQLVTAPYKEISASFIVSAIAGTVQFGDFSPAFLAFTTLCGGIAGTAAVLTVYLSASRNPASLFSTFQPSRVSRAVLVLFVGTLLCLGLFYALATAGTSWCLAPAIVGVFLLFRAVALAAVTLRLKTRFGELTRQQQDAIYQQELQSRQARLKEKQDVERALADSSKRLSEATARTQAWMEEVRQQEEERQKEARREKLRYVLATPMRLTRGIRKRIGLLTTAERFDDAQTELAVDRLFYGEAAKAVVEPTLLPDRRCVGYATGTKVTGHGSDSRKANCSIGAARRDFKCRSRICPDPLGKGPARRATHGHGIHLGMTLHPLRASAMSERAGANFAGPIFSGDADRR